MTMDYNSSDPASMWRAEYNMPYQISSFLNNECCQDVNIATTLHSDFMTKALCEISKKLGTDRKENSTMLMNNNVNASAMPVFNGIFGRIKPDLCRISMNGGIAINTSNGYKTYNVKTGRLTNCSNFAFNVGEDFFFVMPTNKVQKGDIILISGKPHCVIEATKNKIEAFCYEDSSVHTVVPEHHVFLGKNFLYGKIVSMFGNVAETGGIKNIMQFMMLSQMMKGSGTGSSDMSSMLPMMMLMNGSGSIFDGMFDFSENDEEDSDETAGDEE